MYLHYQQVAATGVVKTAADFAVPCNVTGVTLQSDTQDVRYTMDNVAVPTQAIGMIFVSDSYAPEEFLIEDFLRIQFISGAGTDGNLNAHFFAGRNI